MTIIFLLTVSVLFVPESAPVLDCLHHLADPEMPFRIFDIVLYHNEAYMLLLRLRTLRPFVTMHSIGFSVLSFSHRVQADFTLNPLDNEIKAFSKRCFWFNYTHPPEIEESWDREADIRLQLLHTMERNENPLPDDLVMWSDLDEIPLPRGMRWIIANPPTYYYRFWGHFHFYNYRWRSREVWKWAYVMRHGARRGNNSWFEFRPPNARRWRRVPRITLVHCSYCFPSLGLIISKLKSFSHQEFGHDPFTNPNYVYSYVYCGYSLFGGNYSLVDFDDSLGIDFPNDRQFDFLKYRLKFDDLEQFEFNRRTMTELSPCKLPFIKNWTEGGTLPNNLWN